MTHRNNPSTTFLGDTMTLTDRNEITEELENSNSNIKVFPEDVDDMAEDKDAINGEIADLEFEEEKGRYTVRTEDDRLYEICAVCGFTQEMNLKAMKDSVPELVKDTKQTYKQEEFMEDGEFVGTEEEVEERAEGDLCRWNNHRCEQSHPPYEAGYL